MGRLNEEERFRFLWKEGMGGADVCWDVLWEIRYRYNNFSSVNFILC